MDKVSTFPDIPAIKEEAGVWLVRLDQGELTAEETETLQEWLGRSDFHQEYLHKLASNWDNMAIMGELADLFPAPDVEADKGHGAAGGTPWWRSNLRVPIFTAAATAVALILFVTVFNTMTVDDAARPATAEQDYYTAIGEQRSFGLQDGSTITLNTNSRLTVDFSGAHRVVRLEQGEANFQVAENRQRPFVVYVGTGMVWAVGTAFNVRVTSGVVDVTVTEGTVKVFADIDSADPVSLLQNESYPADGGAVALAEAGETVQYNKVIHTLTPVSSGELTQKLAWHQGAMIFKGEPLEEAIIEMARYTEQRLVIVDPSIADTRIGGHFKTGDIATLLATLDDGFNIQSEQVAPNLIHLSAKAGSSSPEN